MGLSRLDNFLKSVRGNIIYVDPNSLDSTDTIENQGNSLTRPFKTIQRALIESARFSYQKGLNNDRFGKTTILLYPGDHIVDNRPGWIPDGANNYRIRNGSISNDFPPFDLVSIFDLTNPNNQLYKFNSIHGGVIVPRGTSIVGLDLRKTKIRPLYVPNPVDDRIERSCVFRLTGGCYLWQFSMFDADPNSKCYLDYNSGSFIPNFSHHKLTCFEYADGTNNVSIDDDFQTYNTDRTDLDMYYEKIGLAYGQSSGREIYPDYPSSSLDIQSKIDEYRIVGSTGETVGISSIRAGDGVTSNTTVTVETVTPVLGLDVDTPFRISGIFASDYNGQFTVSEKVSDTTIKYKVENPPILANPSSTGGSLSLNSDTVTSASPYIFNISLRSVYGMCGLLADGDKASGFKSMVVAQFTGIGLQKDDNAFVIYDENSGTYLDNTVSGYENISTNSRAVFKPFYRNFHIKAINDAFIQNVSVFAIGYAEHFSVESGGDMSITNSNSNFGSKALVASGFRRNAFSQDDQGYITHIIPPKEFSKIETSIEFFPVDIDVTVGSGLTSRLYLYGQTNSDVVPENVLEGYRIGARENDSLKVLLSIGGTISEYSSRIVMLNSQNSSEKSVYVGRTNVGINSISGNILTLTEPHSFLNGESIRILSNNGQLPDGVVPNTVYYAITSANVSSGLTTTTQIKIAKTQNDAVNASELTINNNGGILNVVSRVSDKNSGEIGHPIQFDINKNQWYINVSSDIAENTIYSSIVSLGSSVLGSSSPRTYINRKLDDRSAIDTIYRVRYVIPKDSGKTARPPSDGFVIQESNTSIAPSNSEIQTYFGTGSLNNINEQRNFKFISNATWSLGIANIITELPHNLSVGSEVEIINVKSTYNTSAESNSGFNGTYVVIEVISSKEFSYILINDPGQFENNTTIRNISLPYFKRKKLFDTYYIYRTQEVQKYIQGNQDGIYYLTLLNASNRPNILPFIDEKFSQPVKELYPQVNRDNPNSDPDQTNSFASSSLIGEVFVNDIRNSITKETINKTIKDFNVGLGITDIKSSSSTSHRIYTSIDHGLNRITSVSIINGGSGYGSGTSGDLYNVNLVGFAGSTTGQNATAKITVNGSGTITEVKIMDGGSAYGIGNTLTVVGVATTAGYTQAILSVSKIYDNVGDVIKISSIESDDYKGYNNLYRIADIPVGAAKSFRSVSASGVANISTSLGSTITSNAFLCLSGEAIRVNTLQYNRKTGIASVTTYNRHGLNIDNKVYFTGANESIYNGDFIVSEIYDLNSFSVNIGIGTTQPSATGSIYVYRNTLTSNSGFISLENENINGRMIPLYAGITTTISSVIDNPTSEQISILNIQNLDINIGDYLMVDNEIMRVKTSVSNPPVNPIVVFRGVLGTRATTHETNSVIRRIRINPVELRRHSIMRASGHTFEYVGFGPGNYSTAFPDKQDRSISSQEELLAQSTRKDGGINFYTGMNDKGISYSGNKKLSTVTGQEEIFDTPIQTITGEDISSLPGLNVINPIEGNFTRSIRVEGGSGSKAISQFNGPVIFSNKITSTSSAGIEANSLFLQGNSLVSRKYTVGISTPSLAGNPGDIVYYDRPSKGKNIGWIYTDNNDWYPFGNISVSKDSTIGIFDQVGVSTITPGTYKLLVNSGTSQFSVTSSGQVGIGTTAGQFKLNVNGSTNITGNTNINGTCYATTFSGDGSGLLNLNTSATGWSNIPGTIYNTNFNKVGIGTSLPRFNLEVGAVGAGGTSLWVNNTARFNDSLSANNISVTGIITATFYNLSGVTGQINAGIVTSLSLVVGSAGTVITTNSESVGIGTAIPRAKLDVEGRMRIRSSYESVSALSISSNTVAIDLSKSQNFTLVASSNVNYFTLTNISPDSSSFTLVITQNATGGMSVNIDDFRTSGGSIIPVYWPGGGVLPIVTPTANGTDIYRFMTFDGGLSYYGIVVGQNFKN